MRKLTWFSLLLVVPLGGCSGSKLPNTAEGLTSQLRNPDPKVRCQAAEKLGSMGPQARFAVPELAKLLDDESTYSKRILWADSSHSVYHAAAEALFAIGGPEAFQALISRLGQDYRARNRVASVLGRMGPAHAEYMPLLLGALRQQLGVMENGEVPQSKTQIISYIAAVGVTPDSPYAKDAMETMVYALRVYQKRGWPRNDEELRSVLEVLANLGPQANPALPHLLSLVRSRSSATTKAAAVKVASNLDAEALPLLIEAVQQHEAEVRAAAATGLRGRPAEAYVKLLTDKLAHPDASQRCVAAQGLGEIGLHVRVAAISLVPRLKDTSPKVQAAAATALWQLKEHQEQAFTVLAALTGHPDKEARDFAESALHRIGTKESGELDILIDALCSADPVVRMQAARTLGQRGSKAAEAEAGLVAALKDDHIGVSLSAAKALLAMDAKHTLPVVKHLTALLKNGPEEHQILTCEVLGELGAVAKPALLPLAEAAHNGNPKVRAAAKKALHAIDPVAAQQVDNP